MKVWTLSLNGALEAIFDTEEKAVEARREQLASGFEGGRLAVLSIGRWTVQ